MSSSKRTAASVTMSEIAELADVTRPAVSNWRRRFSDFPKPVGTRPGGGEVFLVTEVHAWLKRHGRTVTRHGPAEMLWNFVDHLRGEKSIEELVEIGCAGLALRRFLAGGAEDRRLDVLGPKGTSSYLVEVASMRPDLVEAFHSLEDASPIALEAIQAVFTQMQPYEAGSAVEELLQLGSRAQRYRRNDAVTSETLRELVARVVDPKPDQTVFDMASGLGGFLLDAAIATDNQAHLVGQEINERTRRLSILRLLAHGFDAQIWNGNSLLRDGFPNLRADVVVCDPPYNLRDWGAGAVADDPRWQFGLPPRQDANLAWIQHALYHLRPGGRAYVFLPVSSLFRRGAESRIRVELLKSGAVEAIVALPRGLAEATSVAVALWVMRSPSTVEASDKVLMIDAASSEDQDARSRGRKALDEQTITAIADALVRWRAAPDDFESTPGLAAATSLLELLGTEASLAPGRWVQAPIESDGLAVEAEIEQTAGRLARELRRLSDAPALPDRFPIAVSDGVSSPWRIRDLAEDGDVSILRATRITPDDYRSQGTPVVMQSDLRGRRDESERKYVNVDELRTNPVFTEPGDVILATIGEKPYAVVDRQGGFVLGGSLQALRIHCDWLDPDVVAAFLSSSRTAQFSVGVAIRHGEAPRPRAATAYSSRDRPSSSCPRPARADATMQAAAETAESAFNLKRALVEGLVSGAQFRSTLALIS